MSDLEVTAARLEALGNPTRLAIYRLLVRAGETGKPVGKIQEQMGVPASTLSHHIRTLELVDLVNREKAGTTHYCRANYEIMDAVIGYLSEECCVESDTNHSQ